MHCTQQVATVSRAIPSGQYERDAFKSQPFQYKNPIQIAFFDFQQRILDAVLVLREKWNRDVTRNFILHVHVHA